MKIGFTGTQAGMTDVQWKKLNDLLEKCVSPSAEFHHGDCIGADAEATISAKELDYRIVMHPPIERSKRAFTEADDSRPPRPYLKRNRDIVDECEHLFACPKGKTEELRSGTWATIRYAKKTKKPVTIIYPDGTTDVF
jgi:hypothetical protein